MLSFFSKKKIIQETPTDQPPIPGPVEQNNGNDFIFVERKPTDVPTYPVPGGMYPVMPPSSGNVPYTRPAPSLDDAGSVPYVQGIPFVLAPQLADETQYSGTSSEVDQILAIITRQMSVDEEMNDYNFNLEKSVLNAIR